jgi:large subunit ribosomal protein L20
MARVKRAVNAKKHHKAILEEAKGYYGDRSRTFAPRTRPCSTRACTRFVTVARARVSSASFGSSASTPVPELHGMSYSRFIAGLNAAGIEVDRRILADLAVNDSAAFGAIVAQANDALVEVGRSDRGVGVVTPTSASATTTRPETLFAME